MADIGNINKMNTMASPNSDSGWYPGKFIVENPALSGAIGGGLYGGLQGLQTGFQLGGIPGAVTGGLAGLGIGALGGGAIGGWAGDVGKKAGPGALDAIKGVGDAIFKPGSTSQGQFDESGKLIEAAKGGTDLGNTVDAQLQKALNGELTDANSEYFKNQTALMDKSSADAKNKMLENMSWGGQTGGGTEARAMMDMNQNLAMNKNNLLAGLQKQQATEALSRAGQLDANQLNLAQLGLSRDSAAAGADLGMKNYYGGLINTGVGIWDKLNQMTNPGFWSQQAVNYSGS